MRIINGPDDDAQTNSLTRENLRQQHLPEKIIYQLRVLPLIDKSCGKKARFPGWGVWEFGHLQS
jgi:hypothetical protein